MSQAGGEDVAAHVGVEEYERDCLDSLRTYSADAGLLTELPPLTLDFGHRAAAPRTPRLPEGALGELPESAIVHAVRSESITQPAKIVRFVTTHAHQRRVY
ncbi:hypothetical protein [Streptomyces sp. BE133]|uniref:hypothetical protein n=1 Tax=Streptomyces sp. BE133 TaxID=3002523 RepID=UPI002E75E2B9|nr:hypothetical protein [Streptomyces sp. BE133]MEE1806551.1 hypothetical protein [Streptomyces sp. BE133]